MDRGCHVVSVTDPYGRILGFLNRVSLHYRYLNTPKVSVQLAIFKCIIWFHASASASADIVPPCTCSIFTILSARISLSCFSVRQSWMCYFCLDWIRSALCPADDWIHLTDHEHLPYHEDCLHYVLLQYKAGPPVAYQLPYTNGSMRFLTDYPQVNSLPRPESLSQTAG
jgi:hypothetical protein